MHTLHVTHGAVPEHTAHSVQQLAVAAQESDRVAPLNEHVLLHLRRGGEPRAVQIVGYDGDELIAYAHVDITDALEGSSAELVIHPRARRQGWGSALLTRVREVGGSSVRIWAHGNTPAAQAFAAAQKLTPVRTLHQLRRSLLSELPPVELPSDVRLRSFCPGRDDAAWLELNAGAFASHPEQGKLTLQDLQARQAEAWFDPQGFLLAEDASSGKLLGFHWTKVHGDNTGAHGHEPIGEVYVVGVDPDSGGRGLGKALTLAGLEHLRRAGLTHVLLYVDDDNTTAMRLYASLGFAQWSTDVQYAEVTKVNSGS